MPRAPRPRVRRLHDVGADAVLIAGAGRAILLQIADPAIGHAIARHSHFAADPLRRLRNTLTFVYALVYGTPQQVTAARSMVNRAHRDVVSAPGENPSFDAHDSSLQLWVAATLYDTAMIVRRRVVGRLAPSELDAVYAEYAVVGTALQMPAEAWPANRVAFDAYWNERLATLEVDDTVRAVAQELLHPHSAPLWLRAAMPLGRLVTAGLLPPAIRAAFDLPWSPARRRRYELAMSTISVVNRMLPRTVREWPKNQLLRDLDRAAA